MSLLALRDCGRRRGCGGRRRSATSLVWILAKYVMIGFTSPKAYEWRS